MARRPRGYPAEYEGDVTLEDGRHVYLRPVVPHDVHQLSAAIRDADEETIRLRFLGGSAPQSPAALKHLVTLDYDHRFAMAAFAADGKGVGIARYEGEQSWPAVELAVAVDPAWRGVGLARALVARVVRRAVEQGATGLIADFYADNVRVADLIEEGGLPAQREVEKGVVREQITLDPRALSWLEDTASPGSPPRGQ